MSGHSQIFVNRPLSKDIVTKAALVTVGPTLLQGPFPRSRQKLY